VWDAVSGGELHSFQHNHIVKSVCFSDDGSLFATASNEKLVRVFDLNKPDAGQSKLRIVQKIRHLCTPKQNNERRCDEARKRPAE
jgi:WD40 repeat protein